MVLYTQPLEPMAGQPCDVFYNPDATSLRGRPDVYVRGGWNRWTHLEQVPTTKMKSTGGIGWLKARLASPPACHRCFVIIFLRSKDALPAHLRATARRATSRAGRSPSHVDDGRRVARRTGQAAQGDSRLDVQATIDVPPDALVADLVFLDSDNITSGFYDNNNGLDYHIPTAGADGTLPPLNVVHISVEMAPIAKVGGMGDVVTALGRAVQEAGHNVEVRPPPSARVYRVMCADGVACMTLFCTLYCGLSACRTAVALSATAPDSCTRAGLVSWARTCVCASKGTAAQSA